MILITGASGGIGGAVLQEVRKTGESLRAMYRSERDAAKAGPGTQIVIADFASLESLLNALEGVTSLFVVCSPIPELVDLESNVIDAAQANGVKHVVLSSALGAGDYPKSFPAWHRRVEDKLRESGLSFTILRPNTFMQNIPTYFAPTIRSSNVFYGSYGEGKISLIDIGDIAAMAALALSAPTAHAGKIYELNGPEALTCAQVAERISAVAGRPVSYVDIPESAQRESLQQMGMPEWQVDALLDLQRYYREGQGGEADDDLARMLGRPLTRIDDLLRHWKDQFEPAAQS